jgi:hypothetical protein
VNGPFLEIDCVRTQDAPACLADWQTQGATLALTQRRHQWALADWILAGIELHGGNATAAYDAAEQILPEYSRATLQQWASLARAFPAQVRAQWPDLFMGHYHAVWSVGSPFSPVAPSPHNSDEQQAERAAKFDADVAARRAQWLTQAQEKKLTVSALRLAIANASTFDGTVAPGATPAPVKPTPAPLVKPTAKAGYQLPLKPKEKTALETLAAARGLTPAQLAAHAVSEFLRVHADEIDGAEQAQAAQRAQVEQARAAAQAIRANELAEQSARRGDYLAVRRELVDALQPVWNWAQAARRRDVLEELEHFRDYTLLSDIPLSTVEVFVGRMLRYYKAYAGPAVSLHFPDDEPAFALVSEPPVEVAA